MGGQKTYPRNVKHWIKRKWGYFIYYSTQAMAEHGIFRTYLFRIEKVDCGVLVLCSCENIEKRTIIRFD